MSSVWCLVCEIQCVISSVWCRLCDVECVMSSGWCRVWLECVMSSVWYPVCDIQSKICYIFFNRWKRWSLNFCKLHQLILNPLNPLNHHLHVMSSSPSPLTHIVQRGWSSLGSSWAPAQRAFTTWWQLGRPAGPPLPPPCKPAPHGGVGTWQQGSRRTCVSTFTFIIKCQLHLHVTSTSFKVFTGPWCSCCSTGATVFLIFTSSPPSPLHLQKSLGTCFSPSPPLPAGPLPPISLNHKGSWRQGVQRTCVPYSAASLAAIRDVFPVGGCFLGANLLPAARSGRKRCHFGQEARASLFGLLGGAPIFAPKWARTEVLVYS